RAGILYSKMLYKPCLEILQKARQLAKKYEYYEILLKIIQMILRVAMEEKKDVPFVEQFQQEYRHAVECIQKINEYRKLYHRLYTFFSKKGNDLRVQGIRKQYKQFLQHPLLAEESKPTGYEEKIYYYLTYGLCYFCLRDVEKSYDYTQKCLLLIRSRPERIT